MYVAHQAPLPMGFPRQEFWWGLPFPSPEDLPNREIQLSSPALAGRLFTAEVPGKPLSKCHQPLNETVLFTCIKWSDENLPSYIVVVQLCLTLCHLMECSTPGFQSFTISQSLLKLMSIESMMPSNHLILCRPLLLLPSIFPSIRVFSNKSVLCILWPKYWSDWHFFLLTLLLLTLVLSCLKNDDISLFKQYEGASERGLLLSLIVSLFKQYKGVSEIVLLIVLSRKVSNYQAMDSTEFSKKES